MQILHDVDEKGRPITINRGIKCLYCKVPLVIQVEKGKTVSNLERTLHQWQCKDSQECFDYLQKEDESSLDFCVDIDDEGNIDIPSIKVRNNDVEVEYPIEEFFKRRK